MEYITNMRQRARKRNWFKFRLLGNGLLPEVVTQKEKEIIVKIDLLRKELIDNFDVESRKLGFAVPDKRCMYINCRCKVIYKLDTPVYKKDIEYSCRKHSKEIEELGVTLIPLNGN